MPDFDYESIEEMAFLIANKKTRVLFLKLKQLKSSKSLLSNCFKYYFY